ncbi:E3 ubiquitin-protein ligase At1g63170-like isoform X1 [Prosopis cineraria]|uniref:E3 ubiquitin-protein ligase At1g63170-like isoform X1 n=1 Tax=Prosopis cineraria TaxID=364024 RepID=UPI00240FB47B|nr:E3 ubiquitin-protein ligase At1g63170-like isoform X1 [Prosopis cineraria]
MLSTTSLPSALPDSAVDPSPLLRYSVSDQLLRRTSGPLRSAARFFRHASGRRMMLREPSVRVRENAAEQLEARQSNWVFSKPVVILDVVWNLAFVASGIVVLGLSVEEKPSVPLRVWIGGYLLQGAFHCVRVTLKYRRYMQTQARSASEGQYQNGISWERGVDFNSSSGSDIGDANDSADEQDQEGYSIRKRMDSANTMFSFIWWLLGFYWITTGGQNLTQDAPQLYWLCITFLAIDIVIVLICVVVACLVGIAVCCCLPCILAFLSVVADKQEGATKEEINQLPKYKFRRADGHKLDVDGDDAQASSCKGIMTECDSDTPAEHVLSTEDAECCICLCPYEDGAELRELPCSHHFHTDCIDKWLHINANCPLCKFNVHSGNHSQV